MANGLPVPEQRIVTEAVVDKGSTNKTVAKLQQQVAEGKDPRAIVESIQQMKPVDMLQVRSFAERAVPTTGKDVHNNPKRTPEEQKSYDAILARADTVQKYERSEALDPTEQDLAEKGVLRIIDLLPQGRALLSGLNPTQKAEMARRLMQDPEFGANVGKVFDRKTNAEELEKRLGVLDKDIQEKHDAWLQKREEQAQKKKVLDEKTSEQGRVAAELEQFKVDAATGNPNAKLKELQDLRKQIATKYGAGYEKSIVTRTNNEAQALDTLKKATPPDAAAIAAQEKLLKDLKKEYAAFEALKIKKDELEARKKQLEEDEKRLAKEVSDAADKFSKADISARRAHTELNLVQIKRGLVHEELSMDRVFADAAKEYFADQYVHFTEAQQKSLEEVKKKTNDERERRVVEHLQRRWDEIVHGWGGERIQDNRETIEADWIVLQRDGPQGVLLNAVRAANRGLSEAEARDMLKNNPDLAQSLQDKVLDGLLGKRLQNGGFTEREAQRIVNSDWGPEALNRALAKNTEAQALMQQLQESGHLRGGIMEWLRTRTGGEIWRAVILILSLGIAGVVLGPLGAQTVNVVGGMVMNPFTEVPNFINTVVGTDPRAAGFVIGAGGAAVAGAARNRGTTS